MTLKLEDINPKEDIRMTGSDLIGYLKETKKQFIEDQQIIEKFETLADYIPTRLQRGYLDGLREEVDDFIAELKELTGGV